MKADLHWFLFAMKIWNCESCWLRILVLKSMWHIAIVSRKIIFTCDKKRNLPIRMINVLYIDCETKKYLLPTNLSCNTCEWYREQKNYAKWILTSIKFNHLPILGKMQTYSPYYSFSKFIFICFDIHCRFSEHPNYNYLFEGLTRKCICWDIWEIKTALQ